MTLINNETTQPGVHFEIDQSNIVSNCPFFGGVRYGIKKGSAPESEEDLDFYKDNYSFSKINDDVVIDTQPTTETAKFFTGIFPFSSNKVFNLLNRDMQNFDITIKKYVKQYNPSNVQHIERYEDLAKEHKTPVDMNELLSVDEPKLGNINGIRIIKYGLPENDDRYTTGCTLQYQYSGWLREEIEKLTFPELEKYNATMSIYKVSGKVRGVHRIDKNNILISLYRSVKVTIEEKTALTQLFIILKVDLEKAFNNSEYDLRNKEDIAKVCTLVTAQLPYIDPEKIKSEEDTTEMYLLSFEKNEKIYFIYSTDQAFKTDINVLESDKDGNSMQKIENTFTFNGEELYFDDTVFSETFKKSTDKDNLYIKTLNKILKISNSNEISIFKKISEEEYTSIYDPHTDIEYKISKNNSNELLLHKIDSGEEDNEILNIGKVAENADSVIDVINHYYNLYALSYDTDSTKLKLLFIYKDDDNDSIYCFTITE